MPKPVLTFERLQEPVYCEHGLFAGPGGANRCKDTAAGLRTAYWRRTNAANAWFDFVCDKHIYVEHTRSHMP
jgi:hypothetical protein